MQETLASWSYMLLLFFLAGNGLTKTTILNETLPSVTPQTLLVLYSPRPFSNPAKCPKLEPEAPNPKPSTVSPEPYPRISPSSEKCGDLQLTVIHEDLIGFLRFRASSISKGKPIGVLCSLLKEASTCFLNKLEALRLQTRKHGASWPFLSRLRRMKTLVAPVGATVKAPKNEALRRKASRPATLSLGPLGFRICWFSRTLTICQPVLSMGRRSA